MLVSMSVHFPLCIAFLCPPVLGVGPLFCTTVVATIMLGVVVDAVAVATRICFFGGVRLFCVCVEVSSLVRLGLSFFIPLLVGVVGVVLLFGELFMAVLWKNPATLSFFVSPVFGPLASPRASVAARVILFVIINFRISPPCLWVSFSLSLSSRM